MAPVVEDIADDEIDFMWKEPVTPVDEALPSDSDDELIASDGEPMETLWHVLGMWLLVESVNCRLQRRRNFFAGGNMFIYYIDPKSKRRRFRGPDFFFVDGAKPAPPRPYWAVWKEDGRLPDVIIELTSPATKKQDLTSKKNTYEQAFKTHEYFCYDFLTKELLGWRLQKGVYVRIRPNEKGWLWCEKLRLWLGLWAGTFQNCTITWVRFYARDGRVVPTYGEKEQAKAETEYQRAEAARQRAEVERRRAEAALAELKRLKTNVKRKTQKDGKPTKDSRQGKNHRK